MRVTGLGHLLFAAGFAGLGVLSLGSGDFALNWQPVPAWVPWREALAYASGFMLLTSGLGLLVKRTATLSATVLTINLLIWLVLLRAPRVMANPASESRWLGFGETMMLVAGGWLLVVSFSGQEGTLSGNLAAADRHVRIAQVLFAVSLPVVGLSHFTSVQGTAALVPAWLPAHIALAYLTGAAHTAAGVGLLLAVVPRLAATLEAIMISLFTLLVWVPRVAAAPTIRFEWTAMLVSTALAAAGWIVASSLPDTPWGMVRRATQPVPAA
jgi:uncharacterized membrane protein